MKGFDVLHIKSAVKTHSKFDLSRSHITTLNFAQPIAAMHEELVPGDKINVDASAFVRCAPLAVPTYGKADMRFAAFFVPYHQVAEDAEAYFAGKTVWLGQTPVLRHIKLSDFYDLFVSTVTLRDEVSNSNADFDFSYVKTDGSVVKYALTNKGRYFYKILKSLGYEIPCGMSYQSGSAWSTTDKDLKLSAYPILAYCKAWNDWMSQSQRMNTSWMSTLLLNIRQNKAYSYGGSSQYSADGHITASGLYNMLNNIYLQYDNDYFTSAWQNPNNPINASESVSTLPINVTSAGLMYSADSNVNGVYHTPGSNRNLYQRSLDFLRSFDNWVRRNNYAGSREVQQIYARFGIKSDDYRTHYSHVIGTTSFPLQIGDVTSTAQTNYTLAGESQLSPLGEYAGKGIISGNGHFKYDSSDFGMFIIMSWITVKPMYADGFERTVLRNSPLDWFNPEFDGLGADPISVREVYDNCKRVSPFKSDGSNIYGFTERYNAYKFGRDQITGDMSLFDDNQCWHFGRDLSGVRDKNQLVAQSQSMNAMSPIDSEYNRIFAITDQEEDKFYVTMYFKTSAIRPMKNLSGVAELGEGDLNVERNGNTMS